VGILASIIPGSMLASLQEGLFDLSYIDDTSQTESEGLLADAGAAIAESDAFKAWEKAISDGLDDCLKQDFAFDWDKRPEDCVDGLHPTFFFWNATHTETWGDFGQGFQVLQLQEVGALAVLRDTKNVEPDTAYWDETGKARFRIFDTYSNSNKCSATCDQFSTLNTVLNPNIWYGVFSSLGLADGWTLAHAVATLPTDTHPTTLNKYLAATDPFPMDPHSAIPLPTRTAARMVALTTFLYTPNSPKLGDVDLAVGDYANLRQYLWDMGGTLLTQMAPAYGVPVSVAPVLIKASANGILGWGKMPVWVDPISATPFTFNFVKGASGRQSYDGPAGPTAYMEMQMSSAFYHEGLLFVTQHYELQAGPTTNTHSCGWDPDCPADCAIDGTENCKPFAAKGYAGGKIPGIYFGSPKGAPGFPAFSTFILTYYLTLQMKSAGRVVIPVKLKGPAAEEKWDFEGFLVHTAFKAESYHRRLENCNYPGGRDLGNGEKDSQGIDCNGVKDTSPLTPYFGLPVYWLVLIRDSAAPGWDPVLTNAEDGAKSITMSKQNTVTSCEGQDFCSDESVNGKGPAFTNFLHYGYEPHLGALVDVSLAGGLGWKWSVSPRHMHLMSDGYKFLPMFWVWNYLHLPAAIGMDLAKLQGVPGALNGFHLFLLGQCMISLVGGVACCFCGV